MNEMNSIAESQITENKALREQYINNVEVLDKVKKLFLIPTMDCMTIRQVADYYGVDYNTLKMCYQRNQSEIDLDGVATKTPKDFQFFKGTSCTFKDFIKDFRQEHGKLIIQFDDNVRLEIPNRGIRVFPKRAILRMGMLLRDSDVAREVRTQLLNTFENATENQRTQAIDEEMDLLKHIGTAYGSGEPLEILNATMALDRFRKRHIAQLTTENLTLNAEKQILAGNALKWTDRKSASKIVRTLAGLLHSDFASTYGLLYNQLLYKHGISLKGRAGRAHNKNKPLIEYLRDDEWRKLYQTIAAICEDKGIRVADLFKKANVDMSGFTSNTKNASYNR